ncbi:transposase [Ancylobacter sp. IITR112]
MKRSRFSEEPIFALLDEPASGVSGADLCRRHSVSDARLYP